MSPKENKRKLSPLALVLVVSASFFAIFLLVSGAFFMARSKGGGGESGGGIFAPGKVGIVELNGVIMDSKRTLEKLERMEESKEIKAVVLRLNSPGGSVAPSQEIFEAVRKFKKPIVASMSSVAASGAYYIACGAKKIYANPGTITGSIGVIMEFVNLEKLYQWAKVHRYAIKTGKYKGMGSDYKELSAEERALLQEMIDDVLGQFKKAVADGRKMKLADVTAIADGRIFSGAQAKEEGLVDELGTLKDAIAAAAELGGIKGKPKIARPSKPHKKWVEYFLEDLSKGGADDENDEDSQSESALSTVARRFVGGVVPQSAEQLPPGLYWLWK